MAETGLQTHQVAQPGTFWLPERSPVRWQARAFGDLVIVAFLIAQVLDGAFTYVGLQVFGHSIEANPLIAWLIGLLGPAGALASAKSVAIVAGGFLHLLHVHLAVAVLTGLYLLLAVGPWTHLLFFF
jgi:hypothetical protein